MERIQHQTRDDIPEKQAKEYNVYHIKYKSDDLELTHSLPYCTWDEQCQDTTNRALTHLILIFNLGVYIFYVIAKCNHTKNKHEYNTHQTDIEKLLRHQTYGLENVSQNLNWTYEVNEMDKYDRRIDESCDEWDKYV